jgi:Spy/CpxP family protein refolding chaperone
MKRIFTSALALLLLAGAVQAQENTDKKKEKHDKHQKMAQHHDGMKEALNLSADQQARIKAIHEQEKAEGEKLKNSKLTIEEHKAQRKALHEKYQAQVKAVLTAEQIQKMESMRNKMAEKHHEKADMQNRKLGEKGRHGEQGVKRAEGSRDTIRAHSRMDRSMKERKDRDPKEIADELDLTADQKAKAKDIRQNYKVKMEAIKNDNSLSQEQKKEKFQALMKAQQEEMKSILTKEQAEKMNSMRKQRGAKK